MSSTDFTVNLADLTFILRQIRIAEEHASGLRTLQDIIGPDAALLPFGLRTVDGTLNNLLPGGAKLGAADTLFPRLLDAAPLNDADGDLMLLGPPGSGAPVITNTNYGVPGSVADADPRTISNLIVDMTIANPAAVEAWFANPLALAAFAEAHPGLTPVRPDVIPAAGQLAVTNADLAIIANQSPDIGLSPGFNGWMTLFGQFFDHGLDLVTKGNNGTVYIPLQPDDPLYVAGSPTNFMALTRATPTYVNGVAQHENTTTSWIDQNQTYTSHASHQVFLREYVKIDLPSDALGAVAVSTGRLLDGHDVGSTVSNGAIGNWTEVKAQALEMLGIRLNDFDVHNVPLLKTDQYGKFIPGPNGYAQMVMAPDAFHATNWFEEGTAAGITTAGSIGTGHAFLNDIAHHAAPSFVDHDHNPATPKLQQIADDDVLDFNGDGIINDEDLTAGLGKILDADGDGLITLADLADVNLDGVINTADRTANDRNPLTYDNEMLDAHFITGDGRGNENIGLTTVHSIFHSEHNRVLEANKATILASNDKAVINEWLLIPLGDGDPIPADPDVLTWNGERLFQAARFTTEMQYQHMVFEEFARKIQPNVDLFVFTNTADIDPSIVAEFAHVVYRFGHSMLTDTVDRLQNDLTTVNGDAAQISLVEAFLNPQAYLASDSNGSASFDVDAANGAIIRGMSRQLGNEIDEFVVDALRNFLVGLPLDLAALNIARGRDTAVPSFNIVREQLYAATGDAQLTPYTSWLDFAQNIKNPMSVINFIAAYGTHSSIISVSTTEAKRDAATLLVLGNVDVTGDSIAETAPSDRIDFLNGRGAYANGLGGLNAVDLWIGGLAEEKMEFGGMLGSTFNYVFEHQMEQLQNGDRFYYLSRTQGTNLLNELEKNTFADIVMRNSDLGSAQSTHVSGVLFDTPDFILELDPTIAQQGDIFVSGNRVHVDSVWDNAIKQAIDPKVVRIAPGTDSDGDGKGDGGYLKFSGGEHVVLGGTEGNDTLIGDKGIDTLWGDGGDDYLNAGMESDQVFGGDGDDIIVDPFGDDMLRGNNGNDVISSGSGFDLLFGGDGNDFLMAGTDSDEVFAGRGDDFILGGGAPDTLLGNEGDDWIEGGDGLDGLSGENSELFFNSPIIGHDVLNGQNNDTDYDGESGDDIMVQGAGIQRNNGMLGFDWVIQKGDPNAGTIDLGLSRFVNQQALTLRDRNDSVEAASGWKLDDTLIGTSSPTGAVGDPAGGIVGGPTTDSMLLSQNVALINGLSQFLMSTPGALRGQTVGADATPFAALPIDTTVFDPQFGGDILLGGGGSDLIYGKAGNDLIDGDRWLNVRIEVHQNKDGTGPLVTNLASVGADGSVDSLNEISADMLAGRINPGQLEIVREIITTGAAAADLDVALYAGARTDYSWVRNPNGTVTVTDNVTTPILIADPITGAAALDNLLGDEGIDTLTNIEVLRFTNRDANGVIVGYEDVAIVNRAPTGFPTITGTGSTLTANTASIADANGLGAFSYRWESSADGVNGWATINGATGQAYTVPAGNAAFHRVVVSYTDGGGTNETITSQMTARVGTINNDVALSGTADPNLINGLSGNDTINGGAGSDTVNGGTGNDTFLASVGDGNDAYDGGANVDTYDLSATAAGAAITFATVGAVTTMTSTSTETGTDTLVNVENFNGSQGNDRIFLDVGNNVVNGLGGNDLINAGAGNDVLNGGDGDDTFGGFLGTDDVDGGTGIDTIVLIATSASLNVALNGNITTVEIISAVDAAAGVTITLSNQSDGFDIRGGAFVDTLTGSSGADRITAGAGGDTVNAGGGNDTIVATVGDGNDIYTGGTGTNTYDLSQTTAGATIAISGGGLSSTSAQTGTDTLTGIANIIASQGNDQITVNGGANVIDGGAGNDIIIAGGGADTVSGGAGNDYLTGGLGNDTINGDAGDDTIRYAIGDFADAVNGGAGFDTLVISGSTADNTLDVVFAGTALISFEAGGTIQNLEAVTADLGAGADTLTYNPTGAALTAASVTVNLSTGQASGFAAITNIENVTGGSGADTLTGNANANTLIGGAGDDTLNATVDDVRDVFNGTTGVDTADYSAYSAGLTVTLNGATAAIVSGTGSTGANSDTVVNIDNFVGGSGNDTLTGDGLANALNGGAGNDTLTGGAGRDVMFGGADNDTFDFNTVGESGTAVTAADVIRDFTGGEVDTIDLSTITGTFVFIGTAAFTASAVNQLRYELVDTDGNGGNDSTLIQLDTDLDNGVESSILLQGYTGALLSTDFIL